MKLQKTATAVATIALTIGGLGAIGACTSAEDDQWQQVEEDIDKYQEEEKKKSEGGGEVTTPRGGVGNTKASGDLTVKEAGVGDPYKIGDSLPYMDIAVTNSTDSTKTYEYEWELVNKKTGERIDTMYGTADNVGPGQKVDTGQGDGEEDPMGMVVDNMSPVPVEYKLLYVDRY